MVKLGTHLLQLLYWGHWDSSLNLNTRNIRTKNVGQTHHCSVCSTKPKPQCYRELHLAFCIAKIELEGKPDICGERFCPKSPDGCGIHHYKNGFNEIIKDHWKNIKSISEALEELALAKKAQQLALESKEPECKPDIDYEQYNQRNKEKEMAAKRDRHEAMTKARAEFNTKSNTKAGTKMNQKYGTKFAKMAAKATKEAKGASVRD
ncbi:uncharacterized protein CC84DRAFT_1205594 [Paraphaeosphaeria sporulosa]|uniref:Uncharacterized protein n=1 Tax=Paraphaeosphaeria sporulosa TaxID=1460663 RepID=A0A177CE81_9PLEO|nr:uncharacterized protein CC84DRAFT_1205594 [Paraphaeosphaeria sporulosa]OAG05935.1 hypothetical protein CC84DRAFT_1205594 [Paraphaeosphaeria sporulosa]